MDSKTDLCPSCENDSSTRYRCIDCGSVMCADCVCERNEEHCVEWCEECVAVNARKIRLARKSATPIPLKGI